MRLHDKPEKKESREFPISKLFPNFITITGLCLGLFALRFAISENWNMAVILIVIAAFLDGIDGKVARMLNASSNFGAQLDSLTDFFNFGVVPALTIYFWKGYEIKGFGWAIALFFIVSQAVRLARFNCAIDDDEVPQELKDRFFQGVPAPSGGGLCLLPLILTFFFEQKLGYHPFEITAPMVIVYTAIIALLMVSRIPTISIKKMKVRSEFVSLTLAAAGLFIIALIVEPWITLPLLGIGYIMLMPIGIVSYYRLKRKVQV